MKSPHFVCRYLFIRPVFRIFSRHYMAKILPYMVKQQAMNHQNIKCGFSSKLCHGIHIICVDGENVFLERMFVVFNMLTWCIGSFTGAS